MKLITAKDVFKARRYYLMHPSIRAYKLFEKARWQYEERFPHREVNCLTGTVRIIPW